MNEPIFVLKARDPVSSLLVRQWADNQERLGAPFALIAAARKTADEMDAWLIQKRLADKDDYIPF